MRAPDWSILRQRDFRLLWGAGGISNACRWMEMGVLGWLVLELTNSPWQVALVGAFRSAPMLAFGLFSGLIADRMNRRCVMLITQAGNALVTAALLLSLLVEAIQPWQVFVGAFVLGCSTILDMPSRRSLIYDVVGPHKLVSAMSLETINNTVGKFLGPVIGGFVIEAIGFPGVYTLFLFAYLLTLLLLLQIRANIIGPAVGTQPIWKSLVSGVRYALQNRMVLGVLCTTILMNALGFSYVQLLPVVARDHLQIGPGLMGLLASADGMGTLIGALMLSASGHIRGQGRIFALGALVELICLIGFALSPWYGLSFALLVIVGMGNSGFSTMQSTIILLSAAPGMRGRAVGILGLCIGSTPLGLLELGAVAALFGAPVAIGVNAGLALMLMLPVIARTPLIFHPAESTAAAPSASPSRSGLIMTHSSSPLLGEESAGGYGSTFPTPPSRPSSSRGEGV
jgi:MFS family permease